MSTFDFEDGNGPVPAHRHPKGGGWVADTAYVSETAFVGPNAQVYGEAWVYGKAWVYDEAHVYGEAHVVGEAQIGGSIRIGGTIRLTGGRIENENELAQAIILASAPLKNFLNGSSYAITIKSKRASWRRSHREDIDR